MHKVFLLIGGNEGNRTLNITWAHQLIESKIGRIIDKSSLYESEPWGFTHQQNFINQVLEVESAYSPLEILKQTQSIEKNLGRKTKTSTGYEGRTMDIDILYFDDQSVSLPNLIIPHPRLHERIFTLLPLVEKWADFIHPILKKSNQLLLNECNDTCWAKKFTLE